MTTTDTTIVTVAIVHNNVGAPTPCALCDGWADPPCGFAAYARFDADATRDGFVCDECASAYGPTVRHLIAAYVFSANATPNPAANDIRWEAAFAELGLLDGEQILQ